MLRKNIIVRFLPLIKHNSYEGYFPKVYVPNDSCFWSSMMIFCNCRGLSIDKRNDYRLCFIWVRLPRVFIAMSKFAVDETQSFLPLWKCTSTSHVSLFFPISLHTRFQTYFILLLSFNVFSEAWNNNDNVSVAVHVLEDKSSHVWSCLGVSIS